MFARTQSYSLGRHWARYWSHQWGNAALRHALVLALLALTLFTGPQPAHAVPTASSTPGTVVAWGRNDSGQATVPGNLTDVIAIAANTFHSLALKEDGTVVAWGGNTSGQINIPSDLANVSAIAAGIFHSVALKEDGTVVAWGSNSDGQATVPEGLADVIAIAAGVYHNLALKADGTVVAWGRTTDGRTTVPAGLTNVIAIAAGNSHSMALKADGTIVTWGNNLYGQRNVPAGLTNVTAIAGGQLHSLALKADGTVVAWGDNDAGQSTVPAGLTDVIAIATGRSHNLALTGNGTVIAWGNNNYNQTTVPAGVNDAVAIGIASGYDHSLVLVESSSAQEIDMRGNGVRIVSGDTTPAVADHTDFGAADINGGTVARTFTIKNTGSSTDLTLNGNPSVALSGDHATEFMVAALPSSPVAVGDSTTFQITFDPAAVGVRTATVTIANDDSDENPYTFVIQGTGIIIEPGAALDFDGVDDYVTLPATVNNQLNTNQISVEGWFYPTASSGSAQPMLIGEQFTDDSNIRFTIYQSGTTVVCGFFNGSWNVTSPVALTLNSWQHLACTYDQQNLKLYVNGTVIATQPATAALPNSNGAWYLGRRWDLAEVFTGRMDEVHIWNRALAIDEIQAGMNCELGATPDGLVARYNFNQGMTLTDNSSVSSLTDGSSNNLNGTLSGFALSSNTSTWVAPGSPASGQLCAVFSEIDVQGNSVSIASGDASPATADHTDFGSTFTDGGTVVRTFTIQNTGGADLTLDGSPLVAISGDHAAEFTVTALPNSPVAAGGSTTFQLTFDPGAVGTRTATVTIANDDADENPYTFAVQGTGIVPNAQLNNTACDLIDAINAANSDSASGTCPAGSGADTITLLSDITLSAANNSNNFGSNGLPQITSDITIEGDGHTLSRAVGAPLFRFFYVDSGGTLTLNRLTLHNGDALDANFNIAGAIFNWGTVTVNNSTLSNNNGSSGGAIYNFAGTVTVNNSTFSGNTTSAFGNGGAISNSATVTVNNSTFSGNSSGKGGAINNSGTATVNSSTFSGNSASNGGAIYNGGDNTLTLAGSLLSGNSAANGAELYNEPEGFMPAGIVNSNNGNLFGHSGNAGTSGFTPTASDLVPSVGLSAILASLADNGGPSTGSGTAPLTHALVAGSPAIDAAGDSGFDTDQRGVARPQGCADDLGAFELDGVTCPSPEIDVTGNGVSIASGDNTPDPADHTDFGSANVDGGTVVRTFTIENTGDADLTLDGSPLVAISGDQAAEFTVTASPSSPVTAGDSTTFQITFDPGAAGVRTATVTIASDDSDENPYTFAVQGTGFAPNAQLNGSACDLIDAINAANSDSASGTCPAGSGADTITLLSDITLSAANNSNNFGSNGLPRITSDITIEGDGHTLSRAVGAPLFRFFSVDSGGTLTLNSLTLHNGDALDANSNNAGAIVNNGTVTVNDSTFSNNNGFFGGAIVNQFTGTITVNNSTFSGNTASGAGGAIYNLKTVTVNNSTFSGNTASRDGGAIYNLKTVTVNSSTFSGNSAGNGGAVYNYAGSTLTLVRSLLSGNSASDGAELYNDPQRSGPAGPIPGGIINSNNGNLFGHSGNAGTSGFTPTASDIVPTVGLSAILASLADNGGPATGSGTAPLTHALVAGSPAIDAAGDSGLATDQRGIARPQGCADDLGAFELEGVICPPEIDVTGNGVSIVSGDTTPAPADHTDFGSADVDGGTVVRTFTIHNSGDAELSGIAVSVESDLRAAAPAAAPLPFSVTSAPATTVAPGESTQFQITFDPSEAGGSSALVIIESNDSDENPYTFAVNGEGVAPTTITIVLDAQPDLPTNLGFQSSLGRFILDDPAVDDGDAYTNTKSFTVAPGSYSVTRNNPPHWFTTAIACSPDGNAVIDLPQRRATLTVAEGDNVTCTFTVERAVRINARAFNDLVRHNTHVGRRNAGDPWQTGWTMSVAITPTAPIANQVTGGNGAIPQASFINLRAGSYVVCATLPDGSWVPTMPTDLDPVYGQPCKSVTLTPGQAAVVLFGAYEATVAASENVTPEDELITDEDSIVDQPYDPTEEETVTEQDEALRLFLPLVNR